MLDITCRRMSRKLLKWLNKQFNPFSSAAGYDPFSRKIGQTFRLLILLCASLFLVWRLLLYYEVHTQFVRLKAAHYPVSGTELNHWLASLDDKENGALVVTQAFGFLRELSDISSNRSLFPPIYERLTRKTQLFQPTQALVRDYVQTNEPVLAAAREAVQFPRFRYPIDFSFGPDTKLAHLAKVKALAQLLEFRTVIDNEQARSQEWPEDVLLQVQLARTLDYEPTVISHLVRGSMLIIAARTLEWNLNHRGISKAMCSQLQRAFTAASSTNLLPMVFVGERAMLIPVFRLSWKEIQSFKTRDGEEDKPHEPLQYSGKPVLFLWLTGFFERDLDFFLATMQKTTPFVADPFPQSLALTNYLESASKLAWRRGYLLSSMLLPSLSRLIVREASVQASLELAATALAVEQFREERGHFPLTLAELTPQFLDRVPSDPFDGAPLHYRPLAKGYMVYSVDVDGHDDGGRERPEQRKSSDTTSYDLTFTVER